MRVPVKSEKGRVYTIPSPDIVDEKSLGRIISSHNEDTTLDENTKLLIVGTITPKYINNDDGCHTECAYFYCSSKTICIKELAIQFQKLQMVY